MQLHKMLAEMPLYEIKMDLFQPVLKEPKDKIIIPQLLQELKEKIVHFKLAKDKEVQNLIHSLVDTFVFNPLYIVTGAQACQVSARKL